jgi:hypothetical protein
MRAAEPLDCAAGGPVRNILIAAAHPWRWASIRGNSKRWQKALAITYFSTLVLRLFKRVPQIA